MMVAGVGMQFFNNYANNKKNAELQAKQREYQIASAEHDFERMRRIQAESARIALEMEAELHQERMSDINNQYDSLLENFAHGFSISNWPLNVLPFIMKGESFGSLINGTSNSINMHCILTPSNCEWFNEIFYDDLDLRLEAEMNNHWNAQSSHPIVYYGGGWNRRTMKKGFSFPEQIDLNDIDLLKVNLRNVPMMVITPYFDPWLHFRIELWGMGKDSSVPFRIDIPHGDIDYDNRIFSYDYNKENKEGIYEEDFLNVTIEEFVPYLENLVGFVADKYFWSIYKELPILPHILQSPKITNQTRNGYEGMLLDYVEDSLFNVIKAIDFYYKCGSSDYSKLNIILSRYFDNQGKIWDKNISIYQNYVNNKITVTDVVLINKLSLCGLLTSEETADIISKTTSDNLIVVYSINELFDRLLHDCGMYDFYNFKVINNKVCVGFLTSKILPTRSVVAILYKEVNISHKSYEYDLQKKSILVADNELSQVLDLIPKALFDICDRSEIKKQSILIKDKIQLGNETYNENPSILLNHRTERLSFENLMSWINQRKENGSYVQISQMIYQDHYYLILILLDNIQEVVEAETFKMFSIDSKVLKKLDKNLILTINL